MSSRSQILQELNEQLRRMERERRAGDRGAGAKSSCPGISEPRRTRARKALAPATPVDGGEVVSTGIEPLDGLLPAGGWERGMLIEWLAEGEGCGAGTLAVISLRPLLTAGGALVVIDSDRDFYPPAAAALGLDLERMIVIRPEKPRDALWATEQSLACRGVTALLCRIDALHDRAFRRLQLAAERGGSVGMLIRPAAAHKQPTWADVRLHVCPWSVVRGPLLKPGSLSVTTDNGPRTTDREKAGDRSTVAQWRLHLELLRCRKGTSGGAVDVELNHETGLVHLVPELADPADRRRTSGA